MVFAGSFHWVAIALIECVPMNDEPKDANALPLDRIEVVLVDPQGPRNVGSVARAMRNFGLSRLCTVRGVDPTHPEALEMGVHSHELLGATRRVDSVADALADATYVVATTAKPRDRLRTIDPREAAGRILEHAHSGPVSLLFGREDHGLDGVDLRQAHDCIVIHTSPECRALNLSQAALLIFYEIFHAALGDARPEWVDRGRMVTGEMRTHLTAELRTALVALGIHHEGTANAIDQSIERLVALTPMQTRDARLLFALARRVLDRESEGTPEDA